MKQPSGLIPMAMSLAALALVLGHIAIFGVVHDADESAHLWQLLMAGQVCCQGPPTAEADTIDIGIDE
jgi:hypothetical protein